MTFEILPILTFFFLILFVTILGSFFFKKIIFLGNLFLLANQVTLFFKLSQFEEIIFTKNFILNGLNLKFTLLILLLSILVMLLQNLDNILGFKKNIVIVIMFLGVASAIGARGPLLFFLATEITSFSISFFIATSGKDLSSLGALRNYIKSGFSGGVFLLFSYFLFVGTQKFSFYKTEIVNFDLYAISLCLYLTFSFSKIGLSPFNSKLIDKFEYLDHRGLSAVFLVARAGIIYAIIEKFQHMLISANPIHQQYLIYFILIISVITCFYMGFLAIWSSDLNKAIGLVYISQLSFMGIYLCYGPSFDILENLILMNITLHLALVLCAVPVLYLKNKDGSYKKGRWKLGGYSLIWGTLTLIGLPPSLGIIAKITSLSSFIREGYLLESMALITGLFLSVNLLSKIFKFNFDMKLLSNSGPITAAPIRLKIFTMLLLLMTLVGLLFLKNILQII
jgi:formate hydrogenlyase subunit 3/multisubunit Na+/H+ antiporter MnhD subunit